MPPPAKRYRSEGVAAPLPPPPHDFVDLTSDGSQLDEALLDTFRVDCPCCFTPCLPEEMHTFGCRAAHRVCRELCLGRLADIATHNPGGLMCCPMCRERLHAPEVARILGRDHPYAVGYDERELRDFLQADARGFLHCPVQGCEGTFAVDASFRDHARCVACRSCRTEYCARCRAAPFHHQGRDCDAAKAAVVAWSAFVAKLAEGRPTPTDGDSGSGGAASPPGVGPAAEQVAEARAALERFEQLRQDEELKAQRCVRCPKCDRVIERIAGCDHMVCGRNTEGGNAQAGCGHKFNWTEAKAKFPYRPDVPPPPPCADGLIGQLGSVNHHGPAVRCGGAGCVAGPAGSRPLVGLAFQCLHCRGAPLLCYPCMLAELPNTRHGGHAFLIHEPTHRPVLVDTTAPPAGPPALNAAAFAALLRAALFGTATGRRETSSGDEESDGHSDGYGEEGSDEGVVHCRCGLPAVVRTSRTTRNPNRDFYTCGRNQCRFFQWVD